MQSLLDKGGTRGQNGGGPVGERLPEIVRGERGILAFLERMAKPSSSKLPEK